MWACGVGFELCYLGAGRMVRYDRCGKGIKGKVYFNTCVWLVRWVSVMDICVDMVYAESGNGDRAVAHKGVEYRTRM